MSGERTLRGGCHCGRNGYIVTVPQGGVRDAQVLFNTEPHHQRPLATPLAAYFRVPLSWYHSTTYAYFPDETHRMIRRLYTHPSHESSKRYFCGFCGTPLSYWTEQPSSEADFIQLTIGSLLPEFFSELDDMGLIPDEGEDESEQEKADESAHDVATSADDGAESASHTELRQSRGVPWFDSLVRGTRLGNLRTSHGSRHSNDGQVLLNWDIVEFTASREGTSESQEEEEETGATTPGKRKLEDREK